MDDGDTIKRRQTPFYLIDESSLLKNMERIKYLKENFGVKSLLALKCFSTWAVFGLMRQYMDGTTSSSLYEAKLGYQEFGKEVHAYSAAFSAEEIDEIIESADKIIFNSISQLKMHYAKASACQLGLRINPGVSYSNFILADPAVKYSRLGVVDYKTVLQVSDLISGAMFHYNCENNDFQNFCSLLDNIGKRYAELLFKLEWVSLGGGTYFTLDDYPLEKFGAKLKEFSEYFGVQVYLEPGETAITDCGYLVTKILDIVCNDINIAIVDSSIEAHMLDLLVYRENAEIEEADSGNYKYIIAGKSCLAGDVFGTFNFNSELKIGDTIHIADAAGYTMVKKNWFNGLKMPSIIIKRLDGSYDIIKEFDYYDFKNNLS